jgi:NAD(P)-dependent dehydrogenase (short-subunit alcohol dehydrogenase family)
MALDPEAEPLAPRDPLDMAGIVVLITGGTRGIGRGIAERFLDAGAEVTVCGRNEPEHPLGEFVPCDVRDPEKVESLVNVVWERHGHLDVVINNAGGAPPAEAATASPRFTERVIQLNLLAPLYVSQAANRIMQEQFAGGCIVNITSLSGMRPSPGSAAYGAAKAGLINATKSLAIEWAPNVRVNAVSAGLVLTDESRTHYGDDESVARVAATVPLGRMGEPADVADACLFLASPLARYVSGANIELHGGGEPPPFLAAVT